ncbi:hypothetical protein DAEQUDRAFT_336988 [Daedalea quercina L-15889]|uniref:Uncharacterized protein n=1 Tax=Daedalea quercina L-15889 TaxID=1314783 RepID=A0A165PIP3_9APHY|nr:hypothetical protein DAEQUDRAFT_336988 [Daedalea quercina L-15889]
MAATRRWATLNCSTSPGMAEAPTLSSAGHPLIWLDCDIDRDPRSVGPDLLNTLLSADPPVVRPTGRMCTMVAEPGGARVAHEVEILMGEDGFSRMCCYCGDTELAGPHSFKLCSSDNARSRYICSACEGQTAAKRTLLWTLRRHWFRGL